MTRQLRVVFRADASLTIGTGHAMRCLTLASALRERGAHVAFVCGDQPGHLCDVIEQRGFTVRRLTSPNAGTRASAWRDDAEHTRAAIGALGPKPDWIVVDHYGLDWQWERALRPSAGRIMAIDDLADRVHDCDLLLDQNLVAEMRARYLDKVPAACTALLGPEYALLQPSYADLRDRVPPRVGSIRRILIFTSGADRANLTGRTLAAFLGLDQPHIDVDVVVTAGHSDVAAIRRQVAGHPNIHLHDSLPTLASLMAQADLAIGAAGATTWERLCLGLPALVVTLSEHQRVIADHLQRQGLIGWLGHHDQVDESTIQRALLELIPQGIDTEWSNRCRAVVDGRGVQRVCAAMTLDAETPLRARHARVADAGAAGHRDWLYACLRDIEGCHLYTVETADGVALGHVRFQRKERTWEVDHGLAPVCPGDLARPMVAAALLRMRCDERGALTFAGVADAGRRAGDVRRQIGVCSERTSWINAFISELVLGWLAEGHEVTWAHDAADLPAGDACFYLGYERIVGRDLLARFKNNLVVHESDLPNGRGWSPLTWQVLEGADSVVVTLFEAAAGTVDSGPIYLQERLHFQGNELVGQLRRAQADTTIRLCRSFIGDYAQVVATRRAQTGDPTYYRRRGPADGQLNPDHPLRSQFNLLRVSDNQLYPAWCELAGTRYNVHLEAADDVNPVKHDG